MRINVRDALTSRPLRSFPLDTVPRKGERLVLKHPPEDREDFYRIAYVEYVNFGDGTLCTSIDVYVFPEKP